MNSSTRFAPFVLLSAAAVDLPTDFSLEVEQQDSLLPGSLAALISTAEAGELEYNVSLVSFVTF
jgi:hypothetical protein